MAYDKCPNKDTKEWKMLVKHLGENGEFEAYRAFMANGEKIPHVIGMTELKKKIGLSGGLYSVQKQIRIKQRVRLYNKINNTSHSVAFTVKTPMSSTGVLVFNYLPVNKKAQSDRDARRKMEGYTSLTQNMGDFDPVSFSPPASDGRKGPKFFPYAEVKQAELDKMHNIRNSLSIRRRRLKNEDKNKAERVRLAGRIENYTTKIEELKSQIVEIGNLKRLDQIDKFAEDDMRTLDKIFAQKFPSARDLEIAEKLIHVWQQAADFSGNQPHIFYDVEEEANAFKGLKETTALFKKWGDIADGHNNSLMKHQERQLTGAINKTLGSDANPDYNLPIGDETFLSKNLVDISERGNVIFQAVAKWLKDANYASKLESDEVFEKLDNLIEATGLSDFSIFQQTFGNDDARLTGEMVSVWTQAWFDWKNKIDFQRESALEKAEKETDIGKQIIQKENATRTYINALRENTISLDPRILFWDAEHMPININNETDPRPTETEIAEYEKKMRKIMGDSLYDKQKESLERKLEEYKEDLESYKDNIETGMQDDLKKEVIAGWEVKFSPYVYAQTLQQGYGVVNGQRPYPVNRYIDAIPKRTGRIGKDLGFYDNKFNIIEENKSYMELYTYMLDLLQDMKMYLPNEKVGFMDMNSIPTLKKKMLQQMTEGGAAHMFNLTQEVLLNNVRMDDLNVQGKTEEEKEFQLSMLQNSNKRITDYVNLKEIQYKALPKAEREAMDSLEDLVVEWRKDIIDEMAQEKSFDLGRVLKAFSSMAITYHHKAAIQDNMRLANTIINRAIQKRENAAGQQLKDVHGNLLTEKGLQHLKEMMENFMDVAYWGYPSNLPEGRGKTKKLTKTEKALKEELLNAKKDLDKLLEEGMPQDEFDNKMEVVDEQLNALGGVYVASKWGDQLLKYIQLKGMGWNVFAAFANMGFGLISNTIEGSDGRNYSMSSYRKAQALVFNSVLRNASFNLMTTGNARKIRALMDRYDVLKEAKNEIYQTTEQKLFKKIGDKVKWMDPFNPQSRSEYFNQAPVMIAMMMDTILLTKSGEEISFWDAYDLDGNLKEGIEPATKRAVFDLKSDIDKVVKMNHGNYDPDTPLGAKRKFIGRALSQFRTWAFQGFFERFHAEFKDYNLSDKLNPGSNYLTRKGRYRSYMAFVHAESNLAGAALPIGLTLQLLRKLVGAKTTFNDMVNDQFTEVDAANMRKNMTEIMIFLMLSALMIALKAAVDDDDEKADSKKLAYNLLMNQMGRLITDIGFYISPIEFERLSRNAVPAFTLVIDAAKIIDDVGSIIKGENDTLQSGPSKGRSKLWRDIKKVIPGPVQYEKIKNASYQVYKKK